MAEAIKEALSAARHLGKLPSDRMVVSYDREADVIYVSLDRPQRATDSTLQEDDLIIRTRGKRLVGLTILNASRFLAS